MSKGEPALTWRSMDPLKHGKRTGRPRQHSIVSCAGNNDEQMSGTVTSSGSRRSGSAAWRKLCE